MMHNGSTLIRFMCCGNSRVRVMRCVMRDVRIYVREIWKTDLFSDWSSRELEDPAWSPLIQFLRDPMSEDDFRDFFLKTVCCMIQTVCLWSWICLPTAVSAIQWQREDLRDDSSKIFQNCFVYQSFHVSSLAISKKNDYLCRRSGKSRSFFGILEWSAISDASVLEQRRDRCC